MKYKREMIYEDMADIDEMPVVLAWIGLILFVAGLAVFT